MEELISESQIINKDYFYNEIEDVVNCPICLKLILEPITCSKCETCYCKSCITQWMKKNKECAF